MFTLEINQAGTGGLNHVFKKHTQYVLSHTHMPTGEPCLGHSVGFMWLWASGCLYTGRTLSWVSCENHSSNSRTPGRPGARERDNKWWTLVPLTQLSFLQQWHKNVQNMGVTRGAWCPDNGNTLKLPTEPVTRAGKDLHDRPNLCNVRLRTWLEGLPGKIWNAQLNLDFNWAKKTFRYAHVWQQFLLKFLIIYLKFGLKLSML